MKLFEKFLNELWRGGGDWGRHYAAHRQDPSSAGRAPRGADDRFPIRLAGTTYTDEKDLRYFLYYEISKVHKFSMAMKDWPTQTLLDFAYANKAIDKQIDL
jgi:hypothetical protein